MREAGWVFPERPTGGRYQQTAYQSRYKRCRQLSRVLCGRSHADFLNKLGIVEEEADEAVFWIDLAPDAGLTRRRRVEKLLGEGREILAIVVASEKTAKRRRAKHATGKR